MRRELSQRGASSQDRDRSRNGEGPWAQSLDFTLPTELNVQQLFISDPSLESDGFLETPAKENERVPRINKGKSC